MLHYSSLSYHPIHQSFGDFVSRWVLICLIQSWSEAAEKTKTMCKYCTLSRMENKSCELNGMQSKTRWKSTVNSCLNKTESCLFYLFAGANLSCLKTAMHPLTMLPTILQDCKVHCKMHPIHYLNGYICRLWHFNGQCQGSQECHSNETAILSVRCSPLSLGQMNLLDGRPFIGPKCSRILVFHPLF